ncbi:hypothetical protein D9613_003122 [Agrocybe pediades]|uniref:Uncharacterized protein n=1 Tax=Agrocybe pediades TaxID=84607 RepID=A0A8H4VNG6_9AGAR|nr:hypothetical protein D9613_003122 [Agrocybe pediades]
MPSRRRTSRVAPPLRRYSRTKSSHRAKTKPRASHKPRLIRRYRRKILDPELVARSAQAKHSSSNPADKKAKNTAKKVPTHDAHNAVADIQSSPLPRPIPAEITAIPNPKPDTGLTYATIMSSIISTTSDTVGAGYPLIGAISSNTGSPSITVEASVTAETSPTRKAISTASFSALPPLLSRISTSTTTEYTRASFPSDTSFPSPSASGLSRAAQLRAHQMTIVIAVLLAVGSALLLAGAYLAFKIFTRPRGKFRPTPSLPILKDADDDDFFEPKDSPIFGGDSRMSTATGNGPIWTWVQYPQTKPATQAYVPEAKTCPSTTSNDPHYATQFSLPPQQSYANLPHPDNNTYTKRQSMHNVPGAPAKRLSTRSDLFFDAPKSTTAANPDREQNPAYVVEESETTKRQKTKAAIVRRSRQFAEGNRCRESTASFMGLAYDSDVASPPAAEYDYIKTQETPTPETTTEGRAKVRSGYFATGTYPRMSTLPSTAYSIATATRINVGQRNSMSRDRLSIQRSNSKRARDTQALTYALGLASPKTDYGAPSPQPSVYPDEQAFESDQETVERPKRRNPSDRKPVDSVPDVPVIMPMQEAGSGSAFGMDFRRMSLEEEEEEEDQRSASNSVEHETHNTDKPPRVPSPPPLPSLAQMAMQHQEAGLESGGITRGPTYIYGLYEGIGDRKSFVR